MTARAVTSPRRFFTVQEKKKNALPLRRTYDRCAERVPFSTGLAGCLPCLPRGEHALCTCPSCDDGCPLSRRSSSPPFAR